MKLKINGKEVESAAKNIAELSVELALTQQGTAIALNSRIIPRTEWEATALEEGADLFIIKAAYGG